MIYIKRFQYRAQYDEFKTSASYKEPNVVKIGIPGINNESTVVKFNPTSGEIEETFTLLRHWDGTTNLSSNQWKDKVANHYWTMTGSPTHGTDYYEFINTNPASASKYGTLNETLPDLGYHWKVVADVAFRTQSSNPTTFIPLDFGSVGSVSSGKCAVCCGWSASNGKFSPNAKFNGNDSAGTYNPDLSTITAETITTSEVWIRRVVTFGVRSSSASGKDEMFIYIPETGEAFTSVPFTPIRFNRWESGKSFIARSQITPSSSYKFATSARIYDIKVYGTA